MDASRRILAHLPPEERRRRHLEVIPRLWPIPWPWKASRWMRPGFGNDSPAVLRPALPRHRNRHRHPEPGYPRVAEGWTTAERWVWPRSQPPLPQVIHRLAPSFALVDLPLNDGAWEQGGRPSHQGSPHLKHEQQEVLPQPRNLGEMPSSKIQPRTVCACGLGHGLRDPRAAGLSSPSRAGSLHTVGGAEWSWLVPLSLDRILRLRKDALQPDCLHPCSSV